jgi:2-polyprenyl-3-methyl-5-hydroxy-6-metoxy-1,4-benzoquinol methylase
MRSPEYLSVPVPSNQLSAWYEIADLNHFWVIWRFKVLKKQTMLLPKTGSQVFEIGCGNGLVLAQLEAEFGYTADGCDLNPAALQQVGQGAGKLWCYNVFDQKKELLGAYPLVLLFDVLEHVEDDQAFLKMAVAHCCDGGVVALNVPASSTLFSKYDIAAGHYRRYSKKEIRALLERAGLTPLKVSYWGLLLFPLLLIR